MVKPSSGNWMACSCVSAFAIAKCNDSRSYRPLLFCRRKRAIEIFANSQENTCNPAFPGRCLLWILPTCSEYLFYKMPPGEYFFSLSPCFVLSQSRAIWEKRKKLVVVFRMAKKYLGWIKLLWNVYHIDVNQECINI